MAHRSPLYNVMTAAARKAARRLVRDFGEVEQLQVSRKGPADFVTTADRTAEQVLRTELQKARPRYGLFLEESGEIIGGDTSNRWIVDPLDGTTNFLHGIPHFAISIALERDGALIAGLVYEPVNDQMFWAEKGRGAYLNDRRLRVSARRHLADSLLATGIPFEGTRDHARFVCELESVMAVSAGIRRFGAASLDLAYVAAGRYDGFWETGLGPWDLAAGIVLMREAGGFVTDIHGGNDMMATGSAIAANPDLHEPLSKLLRAAGGKVS